MSADLQTVAYGGVQVLAMVGDAMMARFRSFQAVQHEIISVQRPRGLNTLVAVRRGKYLYIQLASAFQDEAPHVSHNGVMDAILYVSSRSKGLLQVAAVPISSHE